jgi:hypothetical protein
VPRRAVGGERGHSVLLALRAIVDKEASKGRRVG